LLLSHHYHHPVELNQNTKKLGVDRAKLKILKMNKPEPIA
jgi:hypothetical protein